MSESNPEPSHQDPAEPNKVDTETETAPQENPVDPGAVPENDGQVLTPEDPADAKPVEVSPEDPGTEAVSAEPVTPDTTVFGAGYTVTPEAGYRRV